MKGYMPCFLGTPLVLTCPNSLCVAIVGVPSLLLSVSNISKVSPTSFHPNMHVDFLSLSVCLIPTSLSSLLLLEYAQPPALFLRF
jgi:hypothetical protein